jgi:thioredoxin-like negative regulator of GroEL
MLSSCSKKAASSHLTHALKTEDFPAFIANPGTLNIVDFSATWCPPCQQLKPILSSIADEYSDTVKLGVVDVDDEKSLASQQVVRGIPDVRFYINGKLVDKFTGGAPKEYIVELIAKHSKNLTPPDAEVTAPEAPLPSSTPGQPSSPALSNPTIQPAKENPLPPGMSKQ